MISWRDNASELWLVQCSCFSTYSLAEAQSRSDGTAGYYGERNPFPDLVNTQEDRFSVCLGTGILRDIVHSMTGDIKHGKLVLNWNSRIAKPSALISLSHAIRQDDKNVWMAGANEGGKFIAR